MSHRRTVACLPGATSNQWIAVPKDLCALATERSTKCTFRLRASPTRHLVGTAIPKPPNLLIRDIKHILSQIHQMQLQRHHQHQVHCLCRQGMRRPRQVRLHQIQHQDQVRSQMRAEFSPTSCDAEFPPTSCGIMGCPMSIPLRVGRPRRSSATRRAPRVPGK